MIFFITPIIAPPATEAVFSNASTLGYLAPYDSSEKMPNGKPLYHEKIGMFAKIGTDLNLFWGISFTIGGFAKIASLKLQKLMPDNRTIIQVNGAISQYGIISTLRFPLYIFSKDSSWFIGAGGLYGFGDINYMDNPSAQISRTDKDSADLAGMIFETGFKIKKSKGYLYVYITRFETTTEPITLINNNRLNNSGYGLFLDFYF